MNISPDAMAHELWKMPYHHAREHTYVYKITPSCVIHSKPINYDIRETKTGTVNQVFNEQAKIKIERKRFENQNFIFIFSLNV